jgi:hypothetical protein
MSPLKKKHHLNVDVKKCGSHFAKCTICESLMNLISKVGENNVGAKAHEMKLQKHNIHQESCRCFYHLESEINPSKEEYFCIILNKMDHPQTIPPIFAIKNKMVLGLGQLPITLIGMIAHGHGNEVFA